MIINIKINANLSKLLIFLAFLLVFKLSIYAQETDPITEAIENEKEKQDLEGLNMYPQEKRELDRIHRKYGISDREKELRLKKQSGQKLKIFEKYRIGRANRKDYMRTKKLAKFNRKIILNRQNEATRKRMIENEKRIKKRDKKIQRKQKRKKFLNLFR